MGIRFRRRIKLWKGAGLNVSGSGLSVSQKVGRTTFNTRGRATTNLGAGISVQHGSGPRRRRGAKAVAVAPQPTPLPVAQAPPKKRGCFGTIGRLLMWTVLVVVALALLGAVL